MLDDNLKVITVLNTGDKLHTVLANTNRILEQFRSLNEFYVRRLLP